MHVYGRDVDKRRARVIRPTDLHVSQCHPDPTKPSLSTRLHAYVCLRRIECGGPDGRDPDIPTREEATDTIMDFLSSHICNSICVAMHLPQAKIPDAVEAQESSSMSLDTHLKKRRRNIDEL